MSNQQTADWLRGLAEKGGKGVVNNIDARCLGRIADEIEWLRNSLTAIKRATINGDVCDDVAWFDQIETLHDFCDRILSRVGGLQPPAEGK